MSQGSREKSPGHGPVKGVDERKAWVDGKGQEGACGPHAPVTYLSYPESFSSPQFRTVVPRWRGETGVLGLAEGVLRSQAGDGL